MITVKPRRVNVERMRKGRNRFGLQYERHVIERDKILDMGMDEFPLWMESLVQTFRVKMFAKYMWTGWAPRDLQIHRDFDLDYNRDRFTFECRPRRLGEPVPLPQ